MVESIESKVKKQINLKKMELELKQLCNEKRQTEIHIGMIERSKDAEKNTGVIKECKVDIKKKQIEILKKRN